MRLVPVHPPYTGWWIFRSREYDLRVLETLYDLLAERTVEESISHEHMPTYAAHIAFVVSEPYAAWYVVEVNTEHVGAVYLSKADEIGIAIFRKWARRGYAAEAVRTLMRLHPRARYLANVAPTNEASAALFQSLEFSLIQHTYARREAV